MADSLAKVERWVRQAIGLNPEAVGKEHIQDAVRQRLAVCGLSCVAGYLERVQADPDEFQQLVELLVVAESWFFRDLQPFRCLADYCQSLAADASLRLLSVPCGTGEEPYSMVMTLLSAGIAPARMWVDAVDISARGLERACAGTYDKTSFRESDPAFAVLRTRFFHRQGRRHVVKEEVRCRVGFHQANVVAPAFLAGQEPYDAIFCRNLLIYLDAPARQAALAHLHRLLKEGGLLYVGHVEAAAVPAALFRPYAAAYPFAFLARRSNRPERLPETALGQSKLPLPTKLEPPARAPSVMTPPTGAPPTGLEKARQAADCGRLTEAAGQCAELLTSAGPNAEVYCLLGVVRQALGEPAAADTCFQKALYLDPSHHETLIHAALLARQRGHEQLALNYQRRAAKARTNQ
jgi:chemotaxis protein methyltransferase WspC